MQVNVNQSLAEATIRAEAAQSAVPPDDVEQERLRQAAKDFEASYIAQMLTFSGLAKALSSGDGKGADAFTGFYVEKIAQTIADKGGFGLAEGIYQQLQEIYSAREELDHAKTIRL